MTIEKDDAPRRSRGPVIAAGLLGGTLVVAGGLYVAAYAMAGDNTPKNASVDGIAIGGMPSEQAVSVLKKELEPQATAPIVLSADGKNVSITPAAAGMTVDYEATVEKAGAGKSWNPSHIWNVLRGGQELDLVTTVDESAVKAAVTKAAPTFAKQPKDAALAVADLKPKVTPGTEGAELQVDEATSKVVSAWRTSTEVAAPLGTIEPELTTAEAEQVAKEQITPLLSGPITVKTTNGKSFPVDVAVLADATTVKAENSTFTVSTDMKKVWSGSQKAIGALKLAKGRDASITLRNGKPAVVPSVDGEGIKEAEFVKVVQPALNKTGAERTVTVKVEKAPAEFTTEMANKLGVKEVTGEFTTYFPHAAYRNTNLSRAAAGINGTFVKPGEIFSLNKTLGPRTAANGYVDGYVISGGKLIKETGGGISQSATTTYNAAFFAGLEDVEHHPHTLYFPRYPAGREATVYYGSLDLRFRNNTQYGVVMQAWVNKSAPGKQGSITVRVWSTKVYDKVTSTEPAKSNFTTGKTVESSDPKCEYQAPIQGFDVSYSRLFHKGGSVVKRENYFWRYHPGDEIKCKTGG
ncbi:VanW family protein [Aestuariimicrobium ganziense]|uniref:VanW family protein n=1 Tax=Aestuariimicrobium ganziense TaxID=2773677 RepID=UPI001941A841|nr:VanW family protein [Aestuariimicrobium ganziense]